MAKETKTRNFNIKNGFLVLYIGLCVLMVIVTLGLSLSDMGVAAAEPTEQATSTLSPAVQTLQAEGYQPIDEIDEEEEVSPEQTEVRHTATPDAVLEPEPTPDS